MKKVYIIGAGGIGISGIARYYNENGYKVCGSDLCNSELISQMKSEGIEIEIGIFPEKIDNSFEKIIYTEAVPKSQAEIAKALNLKIKIQTYPESLAEIANNKKLIAVAGTHGKSTTTSLTSIMMKDSDFGINSLIGTILKEFGNKNTFFSNSEYFALEACEYKRSFTKYNPLYTIITNIDLDHLDYFKDLEDYISAYEELINNMQSGGFVILSGYCENSKRIIGKRKDITYIKVFDDYYEVNGEKVYFKKFTLKIPGNHIKFDANLAYTLGKIIGIDEKEIINSLGKYSGVWRRMETIKITERHNRIMSDYGHHPEEIIPTLSAIKSGYRPEKLIVCFQPHQFSRTIELLDGFKKCFSDADILIIPDIYESRDSEDDKQKISAEILLKEINHTNKIFGNGLENTGLILKNLELEKNNSIILLLGAGDIDNLRNIFNQ